MTDSKITLRKTLIIASLFFGMLFGAGNLIFPVHLGQLAGNNWIQASTGFLTSSVLLPLMALFALSISRANGIYDLAKPIGGFAASAFLLLVHATIGPLCATPRTATVPFEIGFAPYMPKGMQGWGLLIFTAIFFLIVYFLSVTEANITDLIGKILNPVFLIMLFLIFLLAFIHPLGSAKTVAFTADYSNSSMAYTNGFLQGYNTMDALASLIFGITVITSIKALGIKKPKNVSIAMAKSGLWGMAGIAVIYICLIWLGATSLHQFKIGANGGTTLSQISHYYMGTVGNALLATLTTITCLSTAMGLVVAFAQDFNERFPKISYKAFLAANCLLSFIFANLGLDQIIAWSKPILMFLYPIAISLIILGILSPLFKRDAIVYKTTCYLTVIPAIFDLFNAMPPVLRDTSWAQAIIKFAQAYLPMYDLGFSWISFSAVGLIIGLIIHFVKKGKTLNNK